MGETTGEIQILQRPLRRYQLIWNRQIWNRQLIWRRPLERGKGKNNINVAVLENYVEIRSFIFTRSKLALKSAG
jgi:hypothetical protein